MTIIPAYKGKTIRQYASDIILKTPFNQRVYECQYTHALRFREAIN